MSFINYFSENHEEFEPKFKIGDKAITTRIVSSMVGYFEVGTPVEVIGLSWRGYDLCDMEGNRILETGWNSIA